MDNAQSSYTRPDETLCLENLHIGISGLIGAGKSTLSAALGKVLDLPVYFEPVIDNSYLADFYQDPKKFSFPLQIYLLNNRFRQQQQIIWSGRGGIQDRTIYEDGVFAKMLRDSGLMDERDYRTYLDLFANMSNFMKKPNVIIHLDVTPEESIERIRKRARECEKTITLEYLRNLYKAYEVFIADISRVIPVIKVNWSEFRDAAEIAEIIKREYLVLSNIREIHWKEGYKGVVRKDTNTQGQQQQEQEQQEQEQQEQERIRAVMEKTGCTREQAAEVLASAHGDVDNAAMTFAIMYGKENSMQAHTTDERQPQQQQERIDDDDDDVRIVMQQTGRTRNQAAAALASVQGDIIQAILDLCI